MTVPDISTPTFRCADCEQHFFYDQSEEPPSYCPDCERELRATELLRDPDRRSTIEKLIDRTWGMYRKAEQMLTPFRRDGYVYLLGGGGYYKIGRTTNVNRRLRQLEIQLPWPVEIVHTIPCEKHVLSEIALHAMFAYKRSNGEWFCLEYKDLVEIKRISRMRGSEIEYGDRL